MTGTDAVGTALNTGHCHAGELPAIRTWLRRHLSDPDRVVDAELVATELITNAIDHAGGAEAVRITVAPTQRVRIEVDDAAPATRPTAGPSRPAYPRGNGLTIVDALAVWGVVRAVGHKTVWADL